MAVFCCPHARGSLVLAFAFSEGSVEFLCTLASAYANVNIPSCQRYFLEALVPVHPSGVCVPLHFAVFVLANTPEHTFSLCWCSCAVDDLLLSTCAWIPRVCCSVCVPWSVCGIVMHKRQCICQGSAFPCILLCSFVQLRLCVLGASVGKPVQSAVFRCPRVRGYLVFVVAPFWIRASFLACSS